MKVLIGLVFLLVLLFIVVAVLFAVECIRLKATPREMYLRFKLIMGIIMIYLES
jgi:hypothetical protein